MDNLTHSLVAATLARTGLRRAGPGTSLTLLLASSAPDIDIVSAVAGGAAEYLAMHRGPTHGPIGIVTLAIASAGLVRLFSRRANLGRLVAVALVGTVLHVTLDLPTSYGTRLLSPFSQTWFAFDWLPIIDIYLICVLAAGVIAGMWRPAQAPRIAAGVLVLMGVNYAMRGTLHEAAMRRPIPGRAPACGSPLMASWRGGPSRLRPPDGSSACVPVMALPGFLSPLRWRMIARAPGGYRLTDIDLLAGAGPSVMVKTEENAAVKRALETIEALRFLEFARLPAVQTASEPDGRMKVTISDVRFFGNPLRLSPASESPTRLRFAIEIMVAQKE